MCIVGDLNTEFYRANYEHTIVLHRFVVGKTLCYALLHDCLEIDCTLSNNLLFTLDQIIVSQRSSPMLYDSMLSYSSLCEQESVWLLFGVIFLYVCISHTINGNVLININLFPTKHC